jgi:hypothetical protein
MSLMLGLLVVVWYFRRLTLWFVVSSIAPNKSSFKWLKLADLGGAVRDGAERVASGPGFLGGSGVKFPILRNWSFRSVPKSLCLI